MTNNQPKKQPKYDRKTFTKDVLGCLGVFGTIFGSVLLLVSLPTIFSAIFTESPKQKAERKPEKSIEIKKQEIIDGKKKFQTLLSNKSKNKKL